MTSCVFELLESIIKQPLTECNSVNSFWECSYLHQSSCWLYAFGSLVLCRWRCDALDPDLWRALTFSGSVWDIVQLSRLLTYLCKLCHSPSLSTHIIQGIFADLLLSLEQTNKQTNIKNSTYRIKHLTWAVIVSSCLFTIITFIQWQCHASLWVFCLYYCRNKALIPAETFQENLVSF